MKEAALVLHSMCLGRQQVFQQSPLVIRQIRLRQFEAWEGMLVEVYGR